MLRQGAPVREFSTSAEMLAHYRRVNARLWTARPKQVPAARNVEAEDRCDLRAEAERQIERERLAATLAARDELDALVFQVLDPEKLAREPRRIIARVAQAFGVSYAEIVGPGQRARLVDARFAAIAAVREAHPALSLPRIGRHFGGRDHTTILSALSRNARRGVPQPPAQVEP